MQGAGRCSNMRSAPNSLAVSRTACQLMLDWRVMERGNIRNPAQTFPEMGGAVDTDVDQFVFYSQSRSFVTIQPYENMPREKLF